MKLRSGSERSPRSRHVATAWRAPHAMGNDAVTNHADLHHQSCRSVCSTWRKHCRQHKHSIGIFVHAILDGRLGLRRRIGAPDLRSARGDHPDLFQFLLISFTVPQKGGDAKGDRSLFFRFRSPFGNLFVTFFDVFLVTFFAYPLLPPPFCGRVILPIRAPCFREYPALLRFCSFFPPILFRIVFRTYQNKSGKSLCADPFCKSSREENGSFRIPLPTHPLGLRKIFRPPPTRPQTHALLSPMAPPTPPQSPWIGSSSQPSTACNRTQPAPPHASASSYLSPDPQQESPKLPPRIISIYYSHLLEPPT